MGTPSFVDTLVRKNGNKERDILKKAAAQFAAQSR